VGGVDPHCRQDASVESRKELTAATKDFRKLTTEEEKSRSFLPLLKRYQVWGTDGVRLCPACLACVVAELLPPCCCMPRWRSLSVLRPETLLCATAAG
jgi:hypothetical protein